MADDMRLLGARVQVAAGSIQAGAEAMLALQRISVATQTSVAANASTFARLNQSLIQMGGTQADTLRLTELLAKAIKVSGASGAEASSAMLQFGQALGSGKLAGDELRSLLETAPYLMRQLADGLGVPIGALKSMGEQGKLTADVVMSALSKASDQITADFATFPQTVESAFTAMKDAAGRANLAFDEMSGTSAMLTGVNKGLAEVLDKLAEQFGEANGEATKLGRNDAIKEWAERSKVAFSYLVDAVDVTWQTLSVLGRNVAFVFTGIGNEIGGIGAQVAAVMRGDFAGARAIGDAMTQEAAKRRADLDAADAATLARTKTMGAKMREAWAGGGRIDLNDRNSWGAGGKIKGNVGDKNDKKSKGQPFDATGYLSSLEAQTADAYTRIGIIEEEAKRKADELLKQKKISVEQHVQAVKLIEANAAQDRQELAFSQATENLRAIEQGGIAEVEARRRIQQLIDGIYVEAMSPAERIRLEEAEKLAALQDAFEQELLTRQQFDEARATLQSTTNARLNDLRNQDVQSQMQLQSQSANMLAGMMGDFYDILSAGGKKRTALAKTLFLAQKALAVAEIIINTELAASKAGAQLGIFGLPLAQIIRATGYASAGMVAGMAIADVAGGRQYGGPVSANSLYRVNETGRPEMFTAANGSQYMMPTASGRVTSADKLGGGGTVLQVNVTNNHPTAQVTATRNSSGGVDVAVQEIARQIRDNSGPVWSALRGSSNVQGRL